MKNVWFERVMNDFVLLFSGALLLGLIATGIEALCFIL
jgi:hypothetical protein